MIKNFIENQLIIEVSLKIPFLNFGNPIWINLSLRPQFHLWVGWQQGMACCYF